MKDKIKIIIVLIIIIASVVGLGVIGYGYYQKLTYKVQNPIATIEIQDFGTVKLELYPDMAPNTVANFITLANRGFYDGLTFHRTIPDFMIQGGDLKGDGTGSPTLSALTDDGSDNQNYTIEGEFIANGHTENTLKFEKGVIAMARSSQYSNLSQTLIEEDYNSAGSQFFIMTEQNSNLNGLYAGFGRVIEGMDIVDEVANVEVITRDENAEEGINEPVEKPIITSIRVETYGIDYGTPETKAPFDYYTWLMNQYSGTTAE